MESGSADLEKQRKQSVARQIFLSSRALKKLLLEKTRFDGFQLNMAHASILPAIELTGSRLTDIARRAGMSKQALSPYIHELESAGMLTRVEDPQDKRANLLLFTAKGKSLLQKMHESLAEAEQAALAALGTQGYGAIRDGLEHITEALHTQSAKSVSIPKAMVTQPALETLFASAFTYAAIGMALVGLDGRWLEVNEALCRIVGYTKAELLALTFQDITHAEDLSMDLTLMQHLVDGRIPSYNMEKRYIRKDGSIAWIYLTVTLAHRADGSPHHFISQAQDITDRKRREENEKLFFEICPDMLAIANAAGTLTRVNGQWREKLGWTAEELTSRPFVEFVHPEDRDKTIAEAQSTYSGKSTRGFINRYRHKDGSYRLLEWHAIASATGQLYCTVRDVTDSRK
jgi:PAS domain S-box-containing protein